VLISLDHFLFDPIPTSFLNGDLNWVNSGCFAISRSLIVLSLLALPILHVDLEVTLLKFPGHSRHCMNVCLGGHLVVHFSICLVFHVTLVLLELMT